MPWKSLATSRVSVLAAVAMLVGIAVAEEAFPSTRSQRGVYASDVAEDLESREEAFLSRQSVLMSLLRNLSTNRRDVNALVRGQRRREQRKEASPQSPSILLNEITSSVAALFHQQQQRQSPSSDQGKQRKNNPFRALQCMDKESSRRVVMVSDVEYDEKIKCHHSYRKNCFESYVTTYQPETETNCFNEYQKRCHIEYLKSTKDVDIETCYDRLERNCSLPGEMVCSNEAETVCETLYRQLEVTEDEPLCAEVPDVVCQDPDDESTCHEITKKVCQLQEKQVTRTRPETKCRRVPYEVCGPSACPLTRAPILCEQTTRTILEDEPKEKCDLVPQKRCHEVTKLVPKLEPQKKCVNEPKEVCVRLRMNPRTVKRPVVKQWCREEEEEGVDKTGGDAAPDNSENTESAPTF